MADRDGSSRSLKARRTSQAGTTSTATTSSSSLPHSTQPSIPLAPHTTAIVPSSSPTSSRKGQPSHPHHQPNTIPERPLRLRTRSATRCHKTEVPSPLAEPLTTTTLYPVPSSKGKKRVTPSSSLVPVKEDNTNINKRVKSDQLAKYIEDTTDSSEDSDVQIECEVRNKRTRWTKQEPSSVEVSSIASTSTSSGKRPKSRRGRPISPSVSDIVSVSHLSIASTSTSAPSSSSSRKKNHRANITSKKEVTSSTHSSSAPRKPVGSKGNSITSKSAAVPPLPKTGSSASSRRRSTRLQTCKRSGPSTSSHLNSATNTPTSDSGPSTSAPLSTLLTEAQIASTLKNLKKEPIGAAQSTTSATTTSTVMDGFSHQSSGTNPEGSSGSSGTGEETDEMGVEDHDRMQLQALLESRGLPPHLLAQIGIGRIIGRSSTNLKANLLLQGLQSSDEGTQLSSVMEMCSILVMGNEETLAGFPTKQCVPALIALIQMDQNFEIMVNGVRALSYMMEALPRSSSHVVDAIPVLLQKLESIHCMDVAEQSLTTLETLSKRHAKNIILAKGISPCLQFIDFFSMNAQRSALGITANCCANLSPNDFDAVKDVIPIMTNHLNTQDKRCLDSVCSAFYRLVETFHQDPDNLAKLATENLLENLQNILIQSPPVLSSATFVNVIHMLATMCSACPRLAIRLLQKNIANTLRFLLLGQNSTEECLELQTRSPQEYFEITCLIGELMPNLPSDGIFKVNNLLQRQSQPISVHYVWQWKDERTNNWVAYSVEDSHAIEAAHMLGEDTASLPSHGHGHTVHFITMTHQDLMGVTNKPVQRITVGATGTIRTTTPSGPDVRTAFVADDPETSYNFVKSMFGVLYEVYSSSAGSTVRHKCLTALLRIIYYSPNDLLREVLKSHGVSRNLAAMLASPDTKIVVYAIQMANILMQKLPDVFSVYFRREGVVHQFQRLMVQELTPTTNSSQAVASHQMVPTSHPDDMMDPRRRTIHINPSLVSGSSLTGGPPAYDATGSFMPPFMACLQGLPSASVPGLEVFTNPVWPHGYPGTAMDLNREAAEALGLGVPSSGSSGLRATRKKAPKKSHSSTSTNSSTAQLGLIPPPPSSAAVAAALVSNAISSATPSTSSAPSSSGTARKRSEPSGEVASATGSSAVASSSSSSSSSRVSKSAAAPAAVSLEMTLASRYNLDPMLIPSRNRNLLQSMYQAMPSSTSSASGPSSATMDAAQPSGSSGGSSRSRSNRPVSRSFFSRLHPSQWRTPWAQSPSGSSSTGAATSPSSPPTRPGHPLDHSMPSTSMMISRPSPHHAIREKIRIWIKEQAIEFITKYFTSSAEGGDGDGDDPHPAMNTLNQLNRVVQSFSNHQVQDITFSDLKDVLLGNDISPFELIHSGFVVKLSAFLTDPEGREDKIRLFLQYFLGSMSRVPYTKEEEDSLSNLTTTPFSSLVSKLNACVSQLEQFPVRLNDMVGAGSGRGSSNALKFFSQNQLKCNLQRHPSCSTLKQWKGGAVKIDPLALVQAIEKYLVTRGYGKVRSPDEDSDDDNSEEDYEEGMAAILSTQNNRHRLQFMIGDNPLPYNLTVYQAVRQFGSHSNPGQDGAEGDMDSDMPLAMNQLWTATHTIYYRPYTEGMSTSSGSGMGTSTSTLATGAASSATSSAGTSSSSSPVPRSGRNNRKTSSSGKGTKKKDELWADGKVPSFTPPVNEVLDTPKVAAFSRLEDPSIEAISLLRILYAINRNWGHFYRINRTYSPAIPVTEFVNLKLSAKATRQLQDPLMIMTGNLPDWLTALPNSCPFLFPFETRHLLFYITSFDRERALHRLVDSNTGGGSDNHEGGNRGPNRLDRKKKTVSRDDLLRQAEMVLTDASSKSLLEIQYEDEVGTGLGPTLEFYALVSRELQRADLTIWRGEAVSAAHVSERSANGKGPTPSTSIGLGAAADASASSSSTTVASGTSVSTSMDSSDAPPKDSTPSSSTSCQDVQYIFSKHGLFPSPMARNAKMALVCKAKSRFKLLGKFMAKALMDSRMIDIPLSIPFYKWLLGKESHLTICDIGYIDCDFAKTLMTLDSISRRKSLITETQQEGKKEDLTFDGCDLKDLGLDFTLPGFAGIELKKGGKDVSLTLENVEKYVLLLCYWTLHEGVNKQLDSFREGFESVIPLSKLQNLFYPEEMETLFCGSSHAKWDIKWLIECCHVDHGFTLDSQAIKFFFLILSEYDVEEQRKFLKFVTGSPRLPVGGLKSLTPPLTIVRKTIEHEHHSPDDYLPSVMTCVNYLKLPDYSNLDTMRVKLRMAAEEGQNSFHLS